MKEQIKSLDNNLVIYDRRDYDDEIHIYCERIYENKHVHQVTMKIVSDIPFNGKMDLCQVFRHKISNNL